MAKPTLDSVQRLLANIEKGRSDPERARRMALLKRLPSATRVAAMLEAADSVPLRRAAALAISKVGGVGKRDALASLLGDADPRTRSYAASSIAMDPTLARTSVSELAELVRGELPRTRNIGALRPALVALGIAQTPSALKALLAVGPDDFAVASFRIDWLSALALYRSPRVRRALTPFLNSEIPKERVAAILGLLRNGRSALLGELRSALDHHDFYVARDAARVAHDALGTKMVFNPAQLASLKKWWDGSNDLPARVERLQSHAG